MRRFGTSLDSAQHQDEPSGEHEDRETDEEQQEQGLFGHNSTTVHAVKNLITGQRVGES